VSASAKAHLVRPGRSHRTFAKLDIRHVSLAGLRVLLALMFLFDTMQPIHTQTQADEYRVKAAFLFHFAHLVDWPPEALGPNGHPFTLCIVGEDFLPGTLESTVDGKQIGRHASKVRRLLKTRIRGPATSCLSRRTTKSTWAKFFRALRTLPS
jgi:hypothetical protein